MNPFTELDLEKLKVITKRWVKQMQERGEWFEEVRLHRYAAPHFRERTSLQYAVVFDVTHVEQPCGETPQDLMTRYTEGIAMDPYIFFLSKTNYLKWLSLFTPKPTPEDEANDPLTIHSRRFAEQSGMGMPPPFWDNEVDFPPYFKEKDFIHVYRGCPPDNWTKQWLFVPLFKDCLLPDQIQKDESTVLYSRLVVTLNEIFNTPMRDNKATQEEQAEGINNNVSPDTTDKDLWSFTLNGPMWDVTFNGEAGPVTDCIPVRRMLPALEQPSVTFGCIQLVQMTSRSGGETQTEKPDGLSIQMGGEEFLTKHDRDTWQAAASEQYKRYKENPESEQDRWKQFKTTLERIGYYIIETDDCVEVKKSKWKPDVDQKLKKARRTVSKNRVEFLKKIQHLHALQDHMKRYLKVDNGLTYAPPEGAPIWKIDQ